MNPSHRSTLRRIGAGAAAVLVARRAVPRPVGAGRDRHRVGPSGQLRHASPPTATPPRPRSPPTPSPTAPATSSSPPARTSPMRSPPAAWPAPSTRRSCSRSATASSTSPSRRSSDLGATDVYLMGGTAALSQAVEDAVTGAGYTVHRVEGNDRFETAAAAGQVIADQGQPDHRRRHRQHRRRRHRLPHQRPHLPRCRVRQPGRLRRQPAHPAHGHRRRCPRPPSTPSRTWASSTSPSSAAPPSSATP